MKPRSIAGMTVGFLISFPWLVLMYAGQRLFGWMHIPFEFFEFLSRILPGGLVTAAIESLITFVNYLGIGQTSAVGKLIEFGIAYILAWFLLILMAGLYVVTIGKFNSRWWMRGMLAGLVLGTLTILLGIWGGWGGSSPETGISWLLGTSLAWGLALAWGEDRYWLAISREQDPDRKRAITVLALGSAAISAIAFGLGRWINRASSTPEISSNPVPPGTANPAPTPPPARAGFEPIPGTRPEITPIEDFYRVDINLLPPGDAEFLDSSDPLVQRLLQQGGETDIPADSYLLTIDGLVKTPLVLSLEDLRAYPLVEQYATLTCISNPVGGDLISTTLFQGARLKDVLETAQLEPGVVKIKFTCADGYSESLPIDAAMHPETLLCYTMGDQPLTKNHGAPLRLYTPGRYGIKNPKWILKIEAIDEDYLGFWQQRGWTENGIIRTTSVIDTTQDSPANLLKVGGIAFAGSRGINSVECRIDEGEWVPAELNRPLSHLTWVLWRAALEVAPGEHKIFVRATDREGVVQTGIESKAQPDGASGYHSVDISSG